MIPYIEIHTYSIGPLTLQVWGTFVAFGFVAGAAIAAARAKRIGLDPKQVWDMVFWILIASIIGSRLFHVIFYAPAYYLEHPWQALNFSEPGYAIFGGFLGAIVAFAIKIKKQKLDWIQYADTLIWGLPWGCGIGRIGCFLIHDHPGTATDFILGTQYPDGVTRHDHGLYLSLLGFYIGVFFLIVHRMKKGKLPPLFFAGSFLIIYSVVRFFLDFYRIIDVRYAGFTPTQWALVVFFALGAYLLLRGKKLALRT